MEGKELDKIEDPDQLVNRLRIESIMSIRNGIHEKRLIVKEARNQDRLMAVSGYRSLIESYVLEIASLFSVYQGGLELLKSKDYGTVGFTKDDLVVESKSSGMGYRYRLLVDNPDREKFWYGFGNKPFDGVSVNVKGLYSVIELDDPVEFELDLLRYSHSWRGDMTEVTEKVTLQIPLKTLDEMLIDMNLFLAQIGFELEPLVQLESPEI